MDAEPTGPAAPVAAPAPMAVEPASLLDAERRVLAEPEAAEAPPAKGWAAAPTSRATACRRAPSEGRSTSRSASDASNAEAKACSG